MIVHFIEATNSAGGNWGKFMLGRLTAGELATRSALPGYEGAPLLTSGGLRKLNQTTTLVLDLQTGEGACFTLDGGHQHEDAARYALNEHQVWVCPLYEPFLCWLYAQGMGRGRGDITALARHVDLCAPGAYSGHRRQGHSAT